MKTIGINKGLKKMIDEVADDGESVDATLKRLIENAEKPTEVMDGKRTNIGISEETFDLLNEYKIFSTESHISVIYRLIVECGRLP